MRRSALVSELPRVASHEIESGLTTLASRVKRASSEAFAMSRIGGMEGRSWIAHGEQLSASLFQK
jgi:hypothetical protein